MPEATVDENDLFAATEGKIRFAGQSAHMALGSVAMCLKNLQNDVFRTGVFSANLCIRLRTLLGTLVGVPDVTTI